MNITLRIKSCIGKLHVSTLQENVIVISSCVISALSSATPYFHEAIPCLFKGNICALDPLPLTLSDAGVWRLSDRRGGRKMPPLPLEALVVLFD